MKKILFLTNLANDNAEEDLYLIGNLKLFFEVVVSHPLGCEQYLPSVEGVLIRNIWPTHEYIEGWDRISGVLKKSGLPLYNSLNGRGDQQGKDYLIKLHNEGYPVIPSIDLIENIKSLPDSQSYWAKPKRSCDGIGSEKLTKEQLLSFDKADYIIQPFVDFESEPSFFFLDNKFLYGITMPHRLTNQVFEMYTPTAEDLAFAQKFVDWNTLACGIQRIDAIRTKGAGLLLTEIEDLSPALYFMDMEEEEKARTTEELVCSIRSAFA